MARGTGADVESGKTSAGTKCMAFLVFILVLITAALLVIVVIVYIDEVDDDDDDDVDVDGGTGVVTPTDPPVLKKPNFLYILADDLGYNDIGYNNPLVKTPTLDKLATQNGRILTQHYMQHVCTPSRHAFLSGKYPYKSMMQHYILATQHPHCSPTNIDFLPAKLKTVGYSTHLMGKWHLGFCQWACTPLERGFDTFHGLYEGSEDHWTHTSHGAEEYFDWRDQEKNDFSVNGTHTTDVVGTRTIETLRNRDPEKSFFMLVSPTVPHSPLQSPQKFIDMYRHVPNEYRRIALAMISHLDDSVKQIVNVLKETDQYDNTIIIFTSDNGGDVVAHHDNAPFRGGKGALYEGGTRAVGFVHSPLLKNVGIHNGMFHVTDWHSTIMSMAGLEGDDTLDGIDQSDMILHGEPSKRDEIVHNINMETPLYFGQAAIRVGDYKIIWGYQGLNDGWGVDNARTAWTYPPNLEELGIDVENDPFYKPEIEMSSQPVNPTEGQRFNQLIARRLFTVDDIDSGSVNLYHIPDDPEEKNNLASDPDYYNLMMELKYKILHLIEHEYVKPHDTVIADWMDKAVAAVKDDAWTHGWCDELNLDM